jgi:glycerophosphoryl diester phosphodiesterase
MIILSHRGYWKTADEKNSATAFHRSFSLGFGTETDIRDYNGDLVISHDIANADCLKVSEFFEIYNQYDKSLPLALNIKADGLQTLLKSYLQEFGITSYFLFDMSVPDHIQYTKTGLTTFTRQSEYEKECALYDESAGVWLDEFKGHWIDEAIIAQHQLNSKKICIVSPDLHKRTYMEEWANYKHMGEQMHTVMLCTDYPEDAKKFFYEN